MAGAEFVWTVDSTKCPVWAAWKAISAEEVSAEVVAALAAKDAARFQRLVLSQEEIDSLGLGDEKAKQLAKRLETARADFEKFAAEQNAVDLGDIDDVFKHDDVFADDHIEQRFCKLGFSRHIGKKIFNPARKIRFFEMAAPNGDQHITAGRFFNRFYAIDESGIGAISHSFR